MYHILIFTRFPVSGKAKTRLIPALGPEGAAKLHRCMTEHVVDTARAALRVLGAGAGNLTIYCEGAPIESFRAWLGRDLRYAVQSGMDIGMRMRQAFEETFRGGADSVILVGSDLPELTSEILLLAIEGLEGHDMAIGPATDGGYYLIGMRSFHPELFEKIGWGTEKVFMQTLDAARCLGLSFTELPVLSDVDRPEDLTRLGRLPDGLGRFLRK